MRKKVDGPRAKAKIRRKAKRTKVLTANKAKAKSLDIAKGGAEDEVKEITKMEKAVIKSKSKVEAESIERIRAGSKSRENVKT